MTHLTASRGRGRAVILPALLRLLLSAYIGASLVAYRMLGAGDHWASDVVFGATLGWVVGHTIAGKHKQLEIAGFNVLPYSGGTGRDRGFGVLLMKRF